MLWDFIVNEKDLSGFLKGEQSQSIQVKDRQLLFLTLNKMGGSIMEKIKWETELDQALNRSKAENKPIFLDFFNPQ